MSAAETLPTGPNDPTEAPFWDGLREGVLRVPRCADCGTWRAMGRVCCSSCWSIATEWIPVRPAGRLYSWATSQRSFMTELDVDAPYTTGLVELDDAPIRLLGLLVQMPAHYRPHLGDRLEGVIQTPKNAQWPVLRWTLGRAS